MLPSGTTDELEGRSWGTVGVMTLRSTWRKWREARVISERGCVAGNEWVMDGRGGHAGHRGRMKQ